MFQISDPGLVPLILSGLAITSGAFVVMSDRLRSAAWFLWVCGMSVGGVFLSFGAEYLAVVQWTLSTLAALSFLFYSVLFGEEKKSERTWSWSAVAFAAGLGFVVIAVTALRDLPGSARSANSVISLSAVGRALISDDFLALKVLVVALLVVTVGAGILSRPEVED